MKSSLQERSAKKRENENKQERKLDSRMRRIRDGLQRAAGQAKSYAPGACNPDDIALDIQRRILWRITERYKVYNGFMRTHIRAARRWT